MNQVDDAAFKSGLQDYLTRLTEGVYTEVRQAAQEIRNEAMQRTPVNTGALRSAWQVREQKNIVGGVVEVMNETEYASAVEYGTRPHTIKAMNKKVLANKRTGQVFGPVVNHPGTKARPMIRPAVSSVLPKLLDRIKGIK